MPVAVPRKISDVEETQGQGSEDVLDYDLVESKRDFRDIVTILKLSDVAQDKIIFMLFCTNILVTCYLWGFAPKYFYIWFTLKASYLLPYRWYSYKKIGYHYFFLDFCYWANGLVLVYLWLPSSILGDTLRGALFVACYSFSLGPLLGSLILCKSSLVPHSYDKMTSIFMHVSPPMAMWSIRWYSTEEQGFPLCAYPTAPGFDGCSHVTMTDLFCIPMVLYALWLVIQVLSFAVICTMMVLCSYNGACFYIDVFSQRYYFETVLKTKPPTTPTSAHPCHPNTHKPESDRQQNS